MATQFSLATLAGGCFWCTEAVFARVRGVLGVTSGYANGQLANPSYEQVCSGTTGSPFHQAMRNHPHHAS